MINAVLEAADHPAFEKIEEMAIKDPVRRASAAQMLDKLFNEEERTSPPPRS